MLSQRVAVQKKKKKTIRKIESGEADRLGNLDTVMREKSKQSRRRPSAFTAP